MQEDKEAFQLSGLLQAAEEINGLGSHITSQIHGSHNECNSSVYYGR